MVDETKTTETAAPAAQPKMYQLSEDQYNTMLKNQEELENKLYNTEVEAQTYKKLHEQSRTAAPSAPAAPITPAATTPRFLTDQNIGEVIMPTLNKAIKENFEAQNKQAADNYARMQAEKAFEQEIDAKGREYVEKNMELGNFLIADPALKKTTIDEAIKVATTILKTDKRYTLRTAMNRALVGAAREKVITTTQPNTVTGQAEVSTQAAAPINSETEKLVETQKLQKMIEEKKATPVEMMKQWLKVNGDPARANLKASGMGG